MYFAIHCWEILGNWLLKILFSVAVNVAIGLTLARWMPEEGNIRLARDRWFLHRCFCIMSENLFIYAKVDPGAALFNIVLQFYCITLLYLQSALFKKSSMRRAGNHSASLASTKRAVSAVQRDDRADQSQMS